MKFIARLRMMTRWWLSRAVQSRLLLLRRLPAPEVPADVPVGYVAVQVQGNGPRRRFVVRAAQLNHPAFRELLLLAEEEYGFAHAGPLTLPCDHSVLENAIRRISSSETPDPEDPPLPIG